MAQYDPETLIVLQKAFDAAWAAVPDDCRSETRKSELAQLILKLAADGARTPGGRRTGSLVIPSGRSELIAKGRAIGRPTW
jgi:hypothetical protein